MVVYPKPSTYGEKDMEKRRERGTISKEFAAIAKNAEGLVGSSRFTRSALLLRLPVEEVNCFIG